MRQAKLARKARLLRWAMNFYPPYLGAGVRIQHIAGDFREIRVKMGLGWYNRNYVGTQFGGSLYSMTDPFFMLMVMENLGSDYIVWDKAASIRYKKPGYTTLYADFTLTNEELAEIRRRLAEHPELEQTFLVELKDAQGVVHTVVERTVYIAEKNFYRNKSIGGDS